MEKLKFERTCKTCEYNFGNCCIYSAQNYEQHKEISAPDATCNNWSESFEYFCEIQSKLPWYIRKPYYRGNARNLTTLELIEMDFNNEPIDVEIIDLIERTYNVDPFVLAEILGVTPGVVFHAKMQGVPSKRIPSFSHILKIPEYFFDRVTTRDFKIIEKCRADFMKEWESELPYIRAAAEKKLNEKINKKVMEELPARRSENAQRIKRYRQINKYSHDLSDDYKMRWNTIAIHLQNGDFGGNIYYEIGSTEYGLVSFMDHILEFISSLNCDHIAKLNQEGLLLNDINLISDPNGKDVHFTLSDTEGNKLDQCVSDTDLLKYIVGFDIIETRGNGKKKERCWRRVSFAF